MLFGKLQVLAEGGHEGLDDGNNREIVAINVKQSGSDRDYEIQLFKERKIIMKKLLLIICVTLAILYIRNKDIIEMYEYYSVDSE